MGQKVLKATSFGEGKSRVTDYFDQVFRVAAPKKTPKPQNPKTPKPQNPSFVLLKLMDVK
jgi:hypothetical protein